ncbi:MAG: type II secretion system minor pseudopilin GspK [Gammaproteobacteria bacterium]|nr:type II secretion system minor pseudopilin GspK [Gammaproteobacteria bacterium]
MININRQRGVAIIVALLVVSLATVLAVSLVKHLNYDIRRTENILRLDQAHLYNANAVEFSMLLIELDRKNNEYDGLDDIALFHEQASVFPVEGGMVTNKLTDLQSCFNLNNLSKTNTELAAYRAQYIRLLDVLEVDNSLHVTLTDSLIDWLDQDDIPEPRGAEFDYYIGLEKQPYRTANNLLVSPSELRLVKGYTPDILKLIKNEVCVLPAVKTAININTASNIMIESIENLDGHSAQIVTDRDASAENTEDDEPFVTLDLFTKYVTGTLKVKNFNSYGLQTYSEYFLLQTNTQLGAGDMKLFSIIYRDQSSGKTELIRQTGGAL